MNNTTQTWINIPRYKRLYLLCGVIFVSILFFSMYLIFDWGLFLWCLCAYATQFLFWICTDHASESKLIKTTDFELYVKKERKYKTLLSLLIATIIIINLYPIYILIYNVNNPFTYSYTGTTCELGIITGLIEWFWVIGVYNEERKRNNIKNEYRAFLNTNLTKEQQSEKRLKEQEEEELAYKIQKYGNSYKEISLPNNKIILSEEHSIIVIANTEYKFQDIIEANVYDESVLIQSVTTSTDIKSAIGRAVIGGALAGGVGAIIGSNTAKRTSTTNDINSGTQHDYSIYVTINNLSNPIVKIHIGWDELKLNEIYSIFKIIIKRNQDKN